MSSHLLLKCTLSTLKFQLIKIVRLVGVCYGSSSNLTFRDMVLMSMQGVQQRDPLGPLLFALLLQPILKKLQKVDALRLNAHCCCVSISWYCTYICCLFARLWSTYTIRWGLHCGASLSQEALLLCCQLQGRGSGHHPTGC